MPNVKLTNEMKNMLEIRDGNFSKKNQWSFNLATFNIASHWLCWKSV